jgi:surfeit locus 1 family protein
LSRADQKKRLLASFHQRTLQAPLTTDDMNKGRDERFYRVVLQGQFDNEHTFLLDNKTWHGQVGYEVYTPFRAKGLATPILIDRGFVLLGKSRKTLPYIRPIKGEVTLKGMLNSPPTYVALGAIHEPGPLSWPLRVQYINLGELTHLFDAPLYRSILMIEPGHPAAYDIAWRIVIMPPEKHVGYAVQWFALALTLLILFVLLNCRLLTRGNQN